MIHRYIVSKANPHRGAAPRQKTSAQVNKTLERNPIKLILTENSPSQPWLKIAGESGHPPPSACGCFIVTTHCHCTYHRPSLHQRVDRRFDARHRHHAEFMLCRRRFATTDLSFLVSWDFIPGSKLPSLPRLKTRRIPTPIFHMHFSRWSNEGTIKVIP